MFKNYLKISFRNLLKHKGFSFINIVGLAVGLSICLLITLYVIDELSYDHHNEKKSRIYRVDAEINFGGEHYILAVCPDPMAAALVSDYPQIETAVRLRQYGGFLVKKGTGNIQENSVAYADSTIFDVFTLPMIAGDPKKALTEPNTVVITERIALKYFNKTDVVGQSLETNNSTQLKITGVIQNMPTQSHFNFDFLVSLFSEESKQNNWVSNNFNTYVVLREGIDPKTLESKLPEVTKKYVGPQVFSALNTTLEELEKQGSFIRYSLTPLNTIHLHSHKTAELGANGDIQYVYIFSAIAGFILLIACVNFMNLSTARSANRAREVGIRKVLGSLRKGLITQFLMESTLLSFISLVLAVCLALVLLPYFNQLAAKEIRVAELVKPWMVGILLLFPFAIGLLAGSYPSFFLSAFQPVQVLKGKVATGLRTGWLRSGLVVFQFGISTFLIVGTVVIYNQLSYIRNKNLGFDREKVLVVQNCDPLGEQAKTFKQEILKFQGVESATLTGFTPTGYFRSDNSYFQDATLNPQKAVSMQNWYVDEDYIPTLRMGMVKGRNFSKDFPTDSSAIIINESAAKLMGMADPLNARLYAYSDFPSRKISVYTIIGVMKDFNFNSLRQEVSPLALLYTEQRGALAIRTTADNPSGLLTQIENQWKAMAPGQPFSYSFMDNDFNNKYEAEQRIGKISITFASLAVFIACLGLFGLAAYAAEQRTKEIGIRKVLGATVNNIVGMLSKDFIRLVCVALLIAFPFSWWAMNSWLQDFAYRTTIGWEVFVVTAVIALIIALCTVSFQAIKAALANPVKSLRTE